MRLLPRETKPLLYRAVAQAGLGNFDRARQDVAAALRLDPHNTFNAYGILAQVNAHEAGDAQAVVVLERALRGATCSQQIAIYSQIADILATYPDQKLRDGQRALEAGKKACELSDGRSFWALAGLAAAQAECGDFAAAIDCQQKALALATSNDPSLAMSAEALADGVLRQMQRRLALYQSAQPARANGVFGSKIGSRVIARSRDIRLQIGHRPVGEALGETVLVVERVRGEWLWVGRGWIRTDDVVPVEDAVVDYTNRLIEVVNRPASLAHDSGLKRLLGDCDSALRLSPDDAYLYGLRGSIRRMQGDDEGARLDMQRMIEISPQNAATMLMNLGFAARQREDYAHAIELYLRVFGTQNLPLKHEVWTHLQLAEISAECANARFRDGRRAVEAATKACELTNWKRPDALSVLGAAHAECGNYAEAIRWETAALELPPEALATAFGEEKPQQPLDSRKGMIEARLHCYREGKRLYDAAAGGIAERVPIEAIEYANRADERASRCDYATALKHYDAAIRLAPDFTAFYINRASCRDASGDVEGALADFRQAIEQDGVNRAIYWRMLGELLERHGRDADAIDAYAHTLDGNRSPAEQAEAHLAMARIWADSRNSRSRDGRRAVEAASKACELCEWKSREALTVLASGYAQCGDFRQAAQWQAKAIELPPTERRDQHVGLLAADMEQSRLQEFKDRLASYRAGKPFQSPRRTIRVRATRIEWR